MASSDSSLSNALTKDFLTCKICWEQFQKPKILPCLHTYCEACLREMIEDEKLRCPECREETEVSQGTGSLKTNFFINSLLDLVHSSSESDLPCMLCPLIGKDCSQIAVTRCLDCSDNMCHTCASGHRCSRLTHDHQIVDIQDYLAGKYDVEIRSRHAVKCQKHEGENLRFLCKPCGSLICRECRLSQHLVHECLSLSEAAESRKPVIQGLLKGVEGNLKLISSEKSAMEENLQKLKSQDTCIKQIVGETVSRVMKQLQTHQREVLERIEQFVKGQEKAWDLLKSDLELQELVARSTVAFAEKVLSLGNEIEILSLEEMITDRLKHLQNFRWSPVQDTSPQLVISGDMKSASDLFQLSFSSSQQPSLESDTDTLNPTGSHKMRKASISISPADGGLVPKASFFCSFRVKVQSDTKRPRITGICSFGKGEILLADEENRNLKRFTLHGEFKGKLPVLNNKAPCGIATLGKNIVYSAGSQVFLVNTEGGLIWQKALPDTQATHAITAMGTNRMAVSISGYVELYNLQGELMNRIYPQDQYERKFVFLTCNHRDELVASDWYKRNVVVFEESGKIVSSCDEKDFEGRLPGAVCADGEGNIFVTMHELSKVIMFSPNGTLLGDFLTSRNGIERPRVTAILDNKFFAVALNSGTIHIFKF